VTDVIICARTTEDSAHWRLLMRGKPDFHDFNYINSLIGALWPTIAPFAFLTKGRGAVGIDLKKMTDTVRSNTEVECRGEAEYRTQSAPSSTVRQIVEYKPETDRSYAVEA
jgi:hypothetical protein